MYFYATPITAPIISNLIGKNGSKGRSVERGVCNLDDWIREVRVYVVAVTETICCCFFNGTMSHCVEIT